jgi:hypothetical protein
MSVLTTLWSAKGGAGCSVIASMLALQQARHEKRVLLVDLADDLAAVLGVTPPTSPTLAEMARLGVELSIEAIDELAPEVAPLVHLLVAGDLAGQAAEVARSLEALPIRCVADAGCLVRPTSLAAVPFAEVASVSLLVTRSCYLALRRGPALPVSPTGVVLVAEPGRAFGPSDVEAAVGVAVVASIAVDPSIARAVDSGLLAGRAPRGALQALAGAL